MTHKNAIRHARLVVVLLFSAVFRDLGVVPRCSFAAMPSGMSRCSAEKDQALMHVHTRDYGFAEDIAEVHAPRSLSQQVRRRCSGSGSLGAIVTCGDASS